MKILVVGSGGREHALVWKLASDSGKSQLFCAPGNAGTSDLATNVPIDAADIDGLLDWAKQNEPDLTVIGPEVPLCAGIVDRFAAAGLRVFGPSANAARLEGDKAFAKDVMDSAGVPTAKSTSFTGLDAALQYVHQQGAPIVIKATGLAAGKGVFVCRTLTEAEGALRSILADRAFGDSGNTVLIEECLEGEEASILAFVDGEHVVMLASSQDHKRVFNNDEGPNTGGMGAYSPAPVVSEDLWPVIRAQVFDRTLSELKKRGITYRGVLYAGLMLTSKGMKVLEFNCRFGDPETQAILPRISSDLAPVLLACLDGTLSEDLITWREDACVCVVMASGGYPGRQETGKVIHGLDDTREQEDVIIFHAGTEERDGKVVTAGGRVLGITALGADLKVAVRKAYRTILKTTFDQAQYRTDIAARALGNRL